MYTSKFMYNSSRIFSLVDEFTLLNELLGGKQSHFAQENISQEVNPSKRLKRFPGFSNYDEVFPVKKKISLNFVCCSSCSYVCYSKNEWMNSVTAKKVPLEVIIIISRCFKSLHNPLKKELKNVYWVVSWSVIGWLDFFKIHLFQNLHFWKIELVEKLRCNFH